MRESWRGFPHSGDAHSPSSRQEYSCAQLTNAHTTSRAYEAELVPRFSFLRAGARLCAPAHRRAKRPPDTDRGVRCRPRIVSMGSGKGKALVAYSVRRSLQAGGRHATWHPAQVDRWKIVLLSKSRLSGCSMRAKSFLATLGPQDLPCIQDCDQGAIAGRDTGKCGTANRCGPYCDGIEV